MDLEICCLKCRNFTPNKDLHIETITPKNKERMMQKAKCTICGKKNRLAVSRHRENVEFRILFFAALGCKNFQV